MKSEKVFNEGANGFLSDLPDESSAVCYNVTVKKNAYDEPFSDGGASFDCELRLQDCTRSIYIDFNLYSDDSPAAFRARVKKLSTLISHLQDFQTHYIQAYQVYREIKEDHAEANKLEKDEYIPRTGDIIDVIHPDDAEIVYHRDVEVVGVVTKPNDDVPSHVVIWDNKAEPMVLNWEDMKFVKSSVDTQTPSV